MKHTLETFKETYKDTISKDVEIVGEYINFNAPIRCLCKICNNEYMTTPASLKLGCAHKPCSSKKANEPRKLSLEIVKERVAKINPTVKIIVGTYENQNSKLKCECLKCGNIWEASAKKLLIGQGCYYCGIKKRSKSKTFTHNDFIEKMNNIDNSIEFLSDYTKARDKIHCRCKICGDEWYSTADSLMRGHGCKHCSIAKTHEEFMREFSSKETTINILGQYRYSNQKIKC